MIRPWPYAQSRARIGRHVASVGNDGALILRDVSTPHVHPSAHPHGHAHDHRNVSRRALGLVLVLTLAFTVVEVAGGFFTGSLALLADAGHMVSDVLAISLALVAVTLARRPTTARRSFGFQRAFTSSMASRIFTMPSRLKYSACTGMST